VRETTPYHGPLYDLATSRCRVGAFLRASAPGGVGFLLNLERLRSLDDHDLRNSYTIFAKTFSHDDSSNVDLHDFISELQVLQVTLPDNLMSALEILQFIIVADYYPNVSTTYLI
jgi:hypothetical protein